MSIQTRTAATQAGNLLALWVLNESAGTTVTDSGGNGYDGTYDGPALAALTGPDGDAAPTFDGTNDWADVYTAGLSGVFNGAEGTVLLWYQQYSSAIWTDGIQRRLIRLRADANNEVSIYKPTTNDTLTFNYVSGGGSKVIQKSSPATADWVCIAITWSAAADAVKAYFDGTQVGSTLTSLGTWSGSMSSATLGSTTGGGSLFWKGGLALVAVWDTPLTQPEIDNIINGADPVSLRSSVYFDWGSDGTFTDMSAYVLAVRGSIGRRSWQDRVAQGGTCTLVLDNSDQRFSPNYASGPYYGYLVPNVPVRVEFTDSTGTYRLLSMWTVEFTPEPGQNSTRRCYVTCIDRMGQLQDSDISLALQQDQTTGTVMRKITSTVYESGQASGVAYIRDIATTDTITVGSKTYTFKSTLTPAENEVALDTQDYFNAAGAFDAAVNLAAAINRDEGSGTHYAAATNRHDYVTAQGYMGVGWAASNYDSDYLLRETTDDNEALACSFSFDFFAGVSEQSVLPMRRVYLYLKKVGSPTGTLTLRHEIPTGAGGSPSGTLYHANGTATMSEADLSTSFAWVAFDFTEYDVGAYAIPGTSNLHWLVLSTDRSVSGTDYVVWGGDTDGSARFSEDTKQSGSWNGRVAGTHPLMFVPAIIDLTANVHGAWGNSLALSQTGDHITVSASTLTGGVDGPVGDIDADTGVLTLDFAGDTWSEGETNAYTAARDITDSEFGLLWAARDGTITFRDQNWQFEQSNASAALTLNNTHFTHEGRTSKFDLINRVTISYEPRLTLDSTTIARSNKPIYLPGANDGVLSAYEKRWNTADTKNAATAGKKIVVLPFVDSGTGSRIGGLSLSQPLTPGTDYTVYHTKNKDGPDVSGKGKIKIALALVASGVQVEFTNTGNRWNFVHDLAIPGVGLYRGDTVQETREDSTSRSAYGLRAYTFYLPFPADTTEIFVEALAWYLLNRYKDPQYMISTVTCKGVDLIGGVSVFSVEIGDVLTLTETQTAVSGYKLLVIGMDYQLSQHDAPITTFFVERLNDTTYWLLGTTNYGELGTNTYLAL